MTVFVNAVVFLPVLRETPLRAVLGLAFVTVVPGYALVSALFPEADQMSFREGDDDGYDEATTDRWDISGVERAALSLGLSVAVVPLVGLGLNYTPWGIRLVPIMLVLSAVTLISVLVAVRRRLALKPNERFQIWTFPYRMGLRKLKRPETRLGGFLNLTLLLVVLVAAGSVGFALATPSPTEATTAFYLLTENDDGELVTSDYPEELSVGEAATLIVGVDNDEFERVDYTVVVQLQRVERQNGKSSVLERRELGRFDRSLAHNETWRHRHEIAPTMAGEDLRIQYLLYRGDPPEEPTTETAYRSLHLWVDVDGSNGGETA